MARTQSNPDRPEEGMGHRRAVFLDAGKPDGAVALIVAVLALILIGFIIGFSFAIFRAIG